ncbi:MAG: DUF5715 family protein [Patescibacteria group bacterium]
MNENEGEIFELAKPPITSEKELKGILSAQQIEREWWGDKPEMSSLEDLKKALESGLASIVPEVGKGYKISEKVPKEFRMLEKETFNLLNKIAGEWAGGVTRENGEKVFLVVSSLARTTDYQRELIAAGYPAAEHSTHTKLGAFDIAFRWLEKNKPEALQKLKDIIGRLVAEGEANFILEEAVGVYHIAHNPTAGDNSS